MPTGYTKFIEDGTITTGREFLLLCSRAFDVMAEFKDELLTAPLPMTFEPSNYCQEEYDKAKQELAKGCEITLEEARECIRNAHRNRVESSRVFLLEVKSINDRYSRIRKQVVEWVPPTENHEGIKKFALEQIDMCIYPQEILEHFQKIIDTPLDDSDEAVLNYMEQFITDLKKNVDKAKAVLAADIDRAKNRTEFMKKFVDSLEVIDN